MLRYTHERPYQAMLDQYYRDFIHDPERAFETMRDCWRSTFNAFEQAEFIGLAKRLGRANEIGMLGYGAPIEVEADSYALGIRLAVQ